MLRKVIELKKRCNLFSLIALSINFTFNDFLQNHNLEFAFFYLTAIPSDQSPPSCEDVDCPPSTPPPNDPPLPSPSSCSPDSVSVSTLVRPPPGTEACCPPSAVQLKTVCQCRPCAGGGALGGGPSAGGALGGGALSGGSLGGASEERGLGGEATCGEGYVRVLKTEGSGEPGQCCDVFECIEQGETIYSWSLITRRTHWSSRSI